jgi:hypothetical protein
MKKFKLTALLLMITAFTTGCDQPQLNRSRGYLDEFSSNGVSQTTTGEEFEQSSPDLGPGYDNCNLEAHKQSAPLIFKDISICINVHDDNEFKVKFGNQDYVHGTCFIPMYKQAYGNSTYVGIAQCTYHAEDDILTGTFVRNRPGFQNAPINSIMVVKKQTITPFFDCMDAIAKFWATESVDISYQSYSCAAAQSVNCTNNIPPGSSVSPAQVCQICTAAAAQYETNMCNSFVNNSEYLEWP